MKADVAAHAMVKLEESEHAAPMRNVVVTWRCSPCELEITNPEVILYRDVRQDLDQRGLVLLG